MVQRWGDRPDNTDDTFASFRKGVLLAASSGFGNRCDFSISAASVESEPSSPSSGVGFDLFLTQLRERLRKVKLSAVDVGTVEVYISVSSV